MPDRPIARPAEGDELGWSFEATRRRQATLGLQMTPAERLRWLESTLAELLPLVGRARAARAASRQSGGPPPEVGVAHPEK